MQKFSLLYSKAYCMLFVNASHEKTETSNELVPLTVVVCVSKAWYSSVPQSSIIV